MGTDETVVELFLTIGQAAQTHFVRRHHKVPIRRLVQLARTEETKQHIKDIRKNNNNNCLRCYDL